MMILHHGTCQIYQIFLSQKLYSNIKEMQLKNITKVLHKFYSSEDGQQKIYQEYLNRGLEHNQFSIDEQKEPRRFNLFKDYYEVDSTDNDKYISEFNLFNRACFWMATGSGKSLVIIKVIELINQLKNENLIPKNDILLLMPRLPYRTI